MSTAQLADSLQRHQSRRASGVPTVTALTGAVGLGVRAWRAWAGANGRPCAPAAEAPERALVAWVEAAFGAADPVTAAVGWVASACGRAPDGLTRLTRYDLEALWREVPVDPRAPGTSAAFLFLSDRASGAEPAPARLVRELAGASGDFARVVKALTSLYPETLWPALLLAPAPGALPSALRLLEIVAAAEPRVPVGFAAPRDEYESFLARFADTRVGALAREGLVEVRGVSGNQLEARLLAAGIDSPTASVARLAADGVAEDVATAFVSAARAVREPTPSDLASDFRSVHEEFLFGQLESLPPTAGLFRANHPLPFRHGTQTAEADLLADGLKLAVEIDGGFYHLNPDQYRRDRRKDHLYQQHGYLVLRFLAEDVVADLERILDTILGAVAARRGAAQPQPTGVA